MATTRKYGDGCAGSHALNLVGERWALLVVRELLLGPKRFTDLRAGLPDISPNVLTQRLLELEIASVVQRVRLPPPAATWVYRLTPWGQDLEPIVSALGQWGARSPTLPRGLPLSADSLALSFRAMFDAARADGMLLHVALRLGEHRFAATVCDGRLNLVRGDGDGDGADATVTADDPGTLAAIAYDGLTLAAAQRDGAVQVSGDKAAARRFFTLFTLPPPASDHFSAL